MIPSQLVKVISVTLLVVPLSGCVERWLFIRSEPAGARVFLDGKDVGITPVKVPFHHYGTREVLLRRKGRESVSEMVKVSAPWYQWFPIDFISEHLWPTTLQDDHEYRFVLPPVDTASLRTQVERVAADPEGTVETAQPRAPSKESSEPTKPTESGTAGAADSDSP